MDKAYNNFQRMSGICQTCSGIILKRMEEGVDHKYLTIESALILCRRLYDITEKEEEFIRDRFNS